MSDIVNHYIGFFLEQDQLTHQLEIFVQNIKEGSEPSFTSKELKLLEGVFESREESIHRVAVLSGIYEKRYQQQSLFGDEFDQEVDVKKIADTKNEVISEHRIQEYEDKLSLFQILDPKDRDLSHTIEVLVGAPRFERGHETSKPKKTTDDLIKHRKYGDRGSENEIITRPAIMKIEKTVDGISVEEERYCYPNSDVEMLEDILIKIGTRPGSGQLKEDDKGNAIFGVYFTLRQIRRELKSVGKSRSQNQIMHTLKLGTMCVQEVIIASSDGRKINITSPIFKNFIHVDRDSYKSSSVNEKKCYIELHPLVVPCIRSNTYRKYNSINSMRYKNRMAGWFHKRLSHYYVQAGAELPYGPINLSTIINLYGVERRNPISRNHKEFVTALKEMIEAGDVKKYDYKIIKDPNDKRTTMEYQYCIWVTNTFISEMIRFNIDFEHRNPQKQRTIPDSFLSETRSK